MLKKKFVVFVVFLLILFALLTYQSIKGESRFVDFTLYPLQLIEKGASTVIGGVRNIFSTYIMIVGKEEENRELRTRIDELRGDMNRCMEAELENERLRTLLDLTSERPDFITAAEVFARDPTNWFQILWINKGENDGIAKDMVAVTPLGPIGKIHRVFGDEANVILITDVNSSVAVRLQSSRIESILEGRGNNRCYLKYVSKDADVKVGDRVITSGLEGIYPEGLLVGFVTEVRKKEEEVFQVIEVAPVQDLGTVEEVAILKK